MYIYQYFCSNLSSFHIFLYVSFIFLGLKCAIKNYTIFLTRFTMFSKIDPTDLILYILLPNKIEKICIKRGYNNIFFFCIEDNKKS